MPFIDCEKLPSIDVVLVSHNHRDHMDASSISRLVKRDNPMFLVPEGDKKWFLNRGYTRVEEHMWWETSEIKGVDMTFVPAWHWSQRGFFDHNSSLWGGWVISTNKYTVYFAGDTAYEETYFSAIKQVFPQIDVAIMPIGPGDPREFMHRSHMNAEEAGQAFLDCGANYFIPMHWGTFYFGIDMFISPIERIRAWWKKNDDFLPQRLCLLKMCQQFHLEHHKNSDSDMHGQSR